MSAKKPRVGKSGANSRSGYTSNGQRVNEMARKKEERSVRRAYRKEQKAQSYLSEDENFESFKVQLAKLGLQLRDMPGDGNCLFRALGDQLDGNSQEHVKHRDQVVNYMISHRDDFEPFVEDDVPFQRHVTNLKQIGTYAGNDAIVAFARLHQVNVVIHQVGSPCWEINGTETPGTKQLHISYHNGDHYSSVRKIGDATHQPSKIKVLTENDNSLHHKKGHGGMKSSGDVSSSAKICDDPCYMPPDAINGMVIHVMEVTGCQNEVLITQMLVDQDYDIDSTIAMVLHLDPSPDFSDSADIETSNDISGSNLLWEESGTGARLFGGSGGVGGGTSASLGAKPKQQLSTSHRKRQAKLEKKARATERKRQQFMGVNTTGRTDDSSEEEVTVITQNVGMLEI